MGPKLEGKIHIYVGEADNYFLNNAVYLVEDFLKTKNPNYGGEVDYEPRAEHGGDHTRPNAISRLRYHQLHAPKIVDPPHEKRAARRGFEELAVLGRRIKRIADDGAVARPLGRAWDCGFCLRVRASGRLKVAQHFSAGITGSVSTGAREAGD